ncbi:outer membrane protein assembly factor BamE [Pseudoprimorskyibacter insulae]|uniref:Outer membrane protein assembly factor BamE domain-containing protein n=1 Tax=Pseudoprimorskyibacter insulae TaxID=1695997 RepID=A0A2R8AWA7_9RHOB|nr:outer membrane protein assembly factor BamE [Pseudoprimorskyibacter insulae]SPF80331.1 hypothetical protein PRI8871_02135 [Pseudoprimorskyibacter insulae]
MRKLHNKKRAVLAGMVMAVVVSACSASYRNHGYIPLEEDLQMIVPGVDTRATVEDVVGVPTTSGVANDDGYYYIRSTVRTFGAKAPEVIDRTVLAITFDSKGVVSDIAEYGLQDGQVVPITRRVTRSGDGEISFIRKLFGNIGGLSAEQLLGN